MKKTAVVTASVLAALLLGGYTGFAEGSVYELNPVVVTATRTEKTKLDTPANTDVINHEQIVEKGYTNAFEAVRDMSQANAHTYQEDGGDYGGMLSRIRLRGIDNGTLVMVDGNPVNSVNSSSLANVPVDQIEKVEVVKGSNSVLYGPQAMGGVINIITRKPKAGDPTTGNVYGSIGNRYKAIGTNVNTDRFNFGIKKSWTGDLNNVAHAGTTGTGTAINLKDRNALQFYAAARITDKWSATYSHTENKTHWETGSFVKYIPHMYYLGKVDTKRNTVGLTYNDEENGWRGVIGYNNLHVVSRYDKSYPKQYGDADYKGYNFNFDLQKKFKFRDDKDSLVLGTTINHENWNVVNAGYKVDKVNTRNNYSLYESYDHQFTDRYSMIFGLREYWMSKSDYQDSDFQLLPQLQGLYKLNRKSSLYFNVGKSFEMPSLDVGFYKTHFEGPNPGLKPQSSWSYEFGYKYVDDIRTVTADVFHLDVKNKWAWTKASDGVTDLLVNRAKYKNDGVEINYTQKLNQNFDYNLGFTIQDPKSKADSDSEWVQDTAKYILNTGVNYHRGKFMADFHIFSYMKRENAYYTRAKKYTSAKTPADHHLKDSLDATLSLSYKPNDVDTFRLAGYNIFDRHDVLNTYEYYCTPANYVFTYERRF